jgi:hypothetical protein
LLFKCNLHRCYEAIRSMMQFSMTFWSAADAEAGVAAIRNYVESAGGVKIIGMEELV